MLSTDLLTTDELEIKKPGLVKFVFEDKNFFNTLHTASWHSITHARAFCHPGHVARGVYRHQGHYVAHGVQRLIS